MVTVDGAVRSWPALACTGRSDVNQREAVTLFSTGRAAAIELSPADGPRLQRFFDANPAYFLAVTGAPVAEVPRCKTCQSGITAIVGILGLAWLGDTFINANQELIVGSLRNMATAAPWTFSIGLFVASMLLYSQAATARALMPLGLTLGIPPASLVGMFPAVNGYFFIPNYGTLIAAMQFDRTRTTHIGKYLLNHSFMLPGLICTIGAVGFGLLIGSFFNK
jgi:anaerobic C4-dicarboxylate transporter DcuA